MGWKEWPYWVKGGMISFVLLTLIFLLSERGIKTCKMGVPCQTTFLEQLTTTTILPIGPLLDLFHFFDPLVIVVIMIYYFGLGALVGWIVGKIKSGNQ